jgi:hypothetical protein
MMTNKSGSGITDSFILAAALSALHEKLEESAADTDLLDRVSDLYHAYSEDSLLMHRPIHIDLDEAELLNVITTLPGTQSWMLRLEYKGEDKFDLVAEVEIEGNLTEYDLASGLRRGEGFQQIAEDDAAFVSRIEKFLVSNAPKESDQLVREIVEVAVPWDLVANMGHTEQWMEQQLQLMSEGVRSYQVRATLGDVHSDPDLAEAGCAGVWTEVFATTEDHRFLPAAVEAHNSSILVSANPHRLK